MLQLVFQLFLLPFQSGQLICFFLLLVILGQLGLQSGDPGLQLFQLRLPGRQLLQACFLRLQFLLFEGKFLLRPLQGYLDLAALLCLVQIILHLFQLPPGFLQVFLAGKRSGFIQGIDFPDHFKGIGRRQFSRFRFFQLHPPQAVLRADRPRQYTAPHCA